MSITGTFVYSFDCSNSSYANSSLTHLPFVTTDGLFVIDSSSCSISSNTATVSVTYTFNDNANHNTSDGLCFYDNSANTAYYNDSRISNLQIVAFSNVPLSRSGNQFYNVNKLTSIPSDKPTILSITSLNNAFSDCTHLANITDVSGWTMTNVYGTANMFQNCTSITSLNLTAWNITNARDMSSMFSGCNALTDLNLSGWALTNATDLSNMFSDCTSLTSLNISSWTGLTSVMGMSGMFNNCSSLTTISGITGWNVSNVTAMDYMFNGCSALTSIGNISSWNVSNVTTMIYMFNDCSNLTSIGNVETNWNVAKVSDRLYFANNSGLTGNNIPRWSSSGSSGPNVLSAPSGFSVSSISTTSATISFTPPSGAAAGTSYAVTIGGSTYATSYPNTTITITGLTTNTEYSMTMTATNTYGTSASSSAYTFTTKLAAPTIGSVSSIKTTFAKIAFTAPSGAKSGTSYSAISGGTSYGTADYPATNINLSHLTSHTSYTFKIIAINAGGNSADSGTVTFTTATASILSAPSSITARTIGSTTAVLSFTQPTNADNETTYTAKSGGITYGTASYPDTSISLSGLSTSTSYAFTITTTNAAGTSSASQTVSFSTKLDPPIIGSVNTISATTAAIPFTAPSGSTTGTTYTAKSGGITYGTASYPAFNMPLSGMTANTTYAMSITATNANGTSEPSSSVTFTTTSSSSIVINTICFPAKTPIVTNQGIIDIDKLDPEIHTIRNKKIVAITKTITNKKYLVCMEKDTLGKNIPSKRTMISSEHKVLYKGKMVEAKYLTKLDGIYKVKYHGEILYNVLMETHEKMITNNLIVETLHPENIVAELYRYYTNPTAEDQMNYMKIQENYLKNMLELKRRIQRK
jgi:surface protein